MNEQVLGSLEGRLFWTGFRQGALKAAEDFSLKVGGRVISATEIGEFQNLFGKGRVVNYLWGLLSTFWAYGAIHGSEGSVDAFI